MRKTKKSMVKRYKVTGRGKILRRTPGRRHLMSAKSNKQRRKSRNDQAVSPGIARSVLKSLPYAF